MKQVVIGKAKLHKTQNIKHILAFLIIFAFGNFRSFSEITFFTKNFSNTITGALTLTPATSFYPYVSENEKLIPQARLSYEWKTPELKTFAGLQFSKLTIDFASKASYAPRFGKYVSLGAQLIYHFLYYDAEFTEHDILAGTFFNFERGIFSCALDVNYLFKKTKIFALKNFPLVNHNLALSTSFHWLIKERAHLWFGLASYELFNVPLFFSPFFQTGFDWKFTNGFTTGLKLSLQWRDFGTILAYFDHADIELYASFTF